MHEFNIHYVRDLARAAWAEKAKLIAAKIQEDIIDEAKRGETKIKITGNYNIITSAMNEMVQEYFTCREFEVYHEGGYMIISWA